MVSENGPLAAETVEQVPSTPSTSKLHNAENEKDNSVELREENRETEKLQDDSKGNNDFDESVELSEPFRSERNYYREFVDLVNQLRFNCGMLVNNTNVQLGIVLMISINAIMMGIGTYAFVKKDEKLNNIFESIDLGFLIIFTAELFLQFVYHGWRLLLDGWLVFDTIIILTSWSFSSVQVIRAFRIFRALRLVTRIKIMKNLILGAFACASPFTDN
jgi:hypothetical protein